MKCKVFKIHLENASDEAKLNEFLENIVLNQVFSSIVNSGETPFWSVLVLYEDKIVSEIKPSRPEKSQNIETPYTPDTFASAPTKPPALKRKVASVDSAPEPIELTQKQENF